MSDSDILHCTIWNTIVLLAAFQVFFKFIKQNLIKRCKFIHVEKKHDLLQISLSLSIYLSIIFFCLSVSLSLFLFLSTLLVFLFPLLSTFLQVHHWISGLWVWCSLPYYAVDCLSRDPVSAGINPQRCK